MNKLLLFYLELVFILIILFVPGAMAETPNNDNPTEKQIVIKGLSIGMNINDAHDICIKLLSKDWEVGKIDVINSEPFAFYGTLKQIPVDKKRGFTIGNRSFLSGIIIEDGSGKVSRISFIDKLTDYILSINDVDADNFVDSITKNFGLPGLPWIPHGWSYSSPLGYRLTIMTDKALDLEKYTPEQAPPPAVKKVLFD